MKRARVLTGLAVALLLGGCVYYNGMYNTKRLASSARKAERDGRTFEATNLWGQVVTRAETLITRHPDSKYVDEALVLKGLALSRLSQCNTAVAPLGHVSLLPEDAEVEVGRRPRSPWDAATSSWGTRRSRRRCSRPWRRARIRSVARRRG